MTSDVIYPPHGYFARSLGRPWPEKQILYCAWTPYMMSWFNEGAFCSEQTAKNKTGTKKVNENFHRHMNFGHTMIVNARKLWKEKSLYWSTRGSLVRYMQQIDVTVAFFKFRQFRLTSWWINSLEVTATPTVSKQWEVSLRSPQLGTTRVQSVEAMIWFCRSIPAKPTCIRKEKDIPRLPEI